jgi:hypothetical protein
MRRIFAIAAFALFACYSIGEGVAPPLGGIYFPTGLVVSRDSSHLFVVNSDFDLQYNAGTIQSLDLNRIRSLAPRGCSADSDCPSDKYCDVPPATGDSLEHSHWCVDRAGAYGNRPCGVLGERSSSERITAPGRCNAVDLQNPQDGTGSLITDSVAIGAFAADVISRNFPNPDKYVERLFVPVRGESSVNWIDVTADGKLECGQNPGQACDRKHRVGQDPADNSRGLRLPSEPYAIAASTDASSIIVTHQTRGAVSLLINDWVEGPHLEFVYSGLPPMPIAAIAMPQPALVQSGHYNLAQGFLVTYETASRIDLFRFSSDAQSTPARPFLELSASAGVTVNSGGYDVRGIAADDSKRVLCDTNAATSRDQCLSTCPNAPPDSACQSGCQTSYASQLATCANVPVDLYASSRSPSSLLIGHTTPNTQLTPNFDAPSFDNAIPLPTGVSRIQVAKIINPDGVLETRVFVVSFDSRRVTIYDPIRQEIEAYITTGRGPQALAFDVLAPSSSVTGEGHAYAFIGHFTDSYIGVVELDRRRGRSYGKIVLSLGSATPPRTSK